MLAQSLVGFWHDARLPHPEGFREVKRNLHGKTAQASFSVASQMFPEDPPTKPCAAGRIRAALGLKFVRIETAISIGITPDPPPFSG